MTLTGLEPASVSTCKDKHLEKSADSRAAFSDAFSADSGPAAPLPAAPDPMADLPPDVADLARRLAALPEAVRASLLAAVKAAVPAKVAGGQRPRRPQ